MDPNSIRDLIKSTTKPLLIRNLLNWEILQWDLHRWKEILGTQPLQFRQGIYTHTDWPQFENSTKTVQLSFDEFLTFVQETPNKWLYFDYKYLKDWFRNVNELRKHISWDKFGFPERGVEDSTFWLGSKGAHTPMHIDTYGCNIVAQIYGRYHKPIKCINQLASKQLMLSDPTSFVIILTMHVTNRCSSGIF
ncbi:hypothetical protein PPYR_00903 [Photinus pyralis]|uniref:JmjC domain-containing protein n=1 Tax=Photinus pyralis TaxID=7054 RepID=A0A5N4B308_PHOPY|nr:hypothetical protein PPYR_00903 [Photinus pyralis]